MVLELRCAACGKLSGAVHDTAVGLVGLSRFVPGMVDLCRQHPDLFPNLRRFKKEGRIVGGWSDDGLDGPVLLVASEDGGIKAHRMLAAPSELREWEGRWLMPGEPTFAVLCERHGARTADASTVFAACSTGRKQLRI
jgi:hypothetical protein